jgi:transcriptional regulator with XRE-family HTH domain
MKHFIKRGRNMALLRTSQGFSVEEAAFRADTSEKWWHTLEDERRNTTTTIDTIRRVAHALNVEPLVLDIFHLSDEEIRAMVAASPGTPPQATSGVHPGSNIVWLRKQQHMTQKQLAKAAAVSQARLRDIEHWSANVTIPVLERIAAALGVSLFALCTLTVPVEDILDMAHAARVLAGMEVA